MKRLIAATALVALSSGAVSASPYGGIRSRAAVSSVGWAATHTLGMPLLQNVSTLGPLAAATNLKIAVALAMPNRAAADAYLQHVTTPGDPAYRHYLTPTQFTAAFAPSAAAATAVASYLASAGLQNVAIAPNRLLVTANGPAATIAKAFNTSLNLYRINGLTRFAPATPAQVPAALANTVLAVTGLTDLTTMQTNLHYRTTSVALATNARRRAAATTTTSGRPKDKSTCVSIPPSGLHLNPGFFTGMGLPAPPVTGVDFPALPVGLPISPDACGLATLGPQGFQKFYNATNAPTGQNTDVTIIATGDVRPLLTDLPKFWADNGIPASPLSIVMTDPQSTDLSGIGEFDMDSEYSTGMANGLHHLYVYDGASLASVNLNNELNQWVADNRTKIGSMSIGGCEFLQYAFGDTAADDQILLEGALQGQSLFVSSGDEGSACAILANTGTPVGVQSVEYPSSSPYAVSVGGTSLIPASDLSYQYEFSWVGGGGGISYIEAPGYWQQLSLVPSALAGRRGVPDISYPADPNMGGAAVYTGGMYSGIGGTSLATPLSAGAWARLESAHNNSLGYAPPAIYRAYRLNSALSGINLPNPMSTSDLYGGFWDIKSGSNGIYQATPGYDYNTGVGSINVGAMESVIGT